MPPPPGGAPRPAYCEEESEEGEVPVPDTVQTAHVPIAAAPSSTDTVTPSTAGTDDAVLGKTATAKLKAGHDERSDSGYSSHTHATLGSSLDSRLGVTRSKDGGSTTAATVGDNAPSTKESGGAEAIAVKRHDSQRRRDSTAPKRHECFCDKCIAATKRDRLARSLHQHHMPSSQRAPGPAPQPALRRVPALHHVPPDTLPLREHVRPRPSTTTSRARPISFHAGVMPERTFMTEPIYFMEQAPPPREAFYPYPVAAPPQPTPQAFFQPAPHPPAPAQPEFLAPAPVPLAPEAATLRPRPRQWISERMYYDQPERTNIRPQSMHYENAPRIEYIENTRPRVEYVEDRRYKTIEPAGPPLERQLSRRAQRTPLRAAEEEYVKAPPSPRQTAAGETKQRISSREEYVKTPPSPRQSSAGETKLRPAIRHAATTTAAYGETVRPRSTSKEQHTTITQQDNADYGAPMSRETSRQSYQERELRPAIRHTATTTAAYGETRPRSTSKEQHDLGGAPMSRETSRQSYQERERASRRDSRGEKVVNFETASQTEERLRAESANCKHHPRERHYGQQQHRRARSSSAYGYDSLRALEGDIEAYQASKGTSTTATVSTLRSPTSSNSSDRLDPYELRRRRTGNRSESDSASSRNNRASRFGSHSSQDGSSSHQDHNTAGAAITRRTSLTKKDKDRDREREKEGVALRFNPAATQIKMQSGTSTAHALQVRRASENAVELSIEPARDRDSHARTDQPVREKSRRRYSYIGSGVTEILDPDTVRDKERDREKERERSLSLARITSSTSREEQQRRLVPSPQQQQQQQQQMVLHRGGARVLAERIVTTFRRRRQD